MKPRLGTASAHELLKVVLAGLRERKDVAGWGRLHTMSAPRLECAVAGETYEGARKEVMERSEWATAVALQEM